LPAASAHFNQPCKTILTFIVNIAQIGTTALFMSAQIGNLELARLLLESKADVNAAVDVTPHQTRPPIKLQCVS
jgi:hypothetical protein